MGDKSASNNILDIIQRNLKENQAILSQIVNEHRDDSYITPGTFKTQKKRDTRRSLMKFVDIRRNPDRKVRSYTNSNENISLRSPLHDYSSHNDISNNSEEIFQEDSIDVEWKSPHKKRMKMSAPMSGMRKADEVTEEELRRVIIDPRIKKQYRGNQLSTCHQCRQKTQDMKTICRSGLCRGVQGQFCGVCLYNRYGENAKEALLDDNWSCPVCRNICNCSFCLPKKGKRCTGILVPEARKHGFTNVHSFLNSLSKDEEA